METFKDFQVDLGNTRILTDNAPKISRALLAFPRCQRGDWVFRAVIDTSRIWQTF